MKLKICAVSVAMGFGAVSAAGADFSAADALFAKRGEGDRIANIRAARTAYEAALGSAVGADRLKVLTNLNRLDFYEGLVTSASGAKMGIYKSCLDRTELMPSSSAEYFYWRAICLAQWSAEDGLLTALKNTGEVERLLLAGRAQDSRFDGGGFDRGLAAIYLKVPPVNPFGPTRDSSKALTFAESAIGSQAYPGEPDPSTATGDYFYNAYDSKAQALIALDRKAEAVAVLKEAIQRIEQGDLPTGREPETLEVLKDLKATLAAASK